MGRSRSIGHPDQIIGIIITPDTVGQETVTAAWSYAVRYSAKGLDLPDFEAAGKLLLQRHPSWQCIAGPVPDITYSSSSAENDKPD